MKVLIVDTETGGIDPRHDALLQVAGVCMDTAKLTTSSPFSTLVKPEDGLKLRTEALAVNGLTLEKLSGAPSEDSVMKEFLIWAKSHQQGKYLPLLVGWNIDFDEGFLKAACHRHKLPWKFSFMKLDVQQLWMYYRMFECGKSYIGTIEDASRTLLGRKVEHDALADVYTTFEILKKLREGQEGFEDKLPSATSTLEPSRRFDFSHGRR